MARQLLPEDLWDGIEGFLSDRPRSPRGGRPPTDNRIIVAAILFCGPATPGPTCCGG